MFVLSVHFFNPTRERRAAGETIYIYIYILNTVLMFVIHRVYDDFEGY